MSKDDVRASRPARASNGRAGSSKSKRKRRSQWDGELEVIHMALECMNDQLRTIVKWPARALANDTHVRQEFLRLLRETLDLSSLDRALCERQLISRMDNMRAGVS
ncbi:retrotransposon protein [Cucumis melo var. makuwa]|uniref:Retrotransposon protein n=2 Tax=Cucumis melo TaxID=3656 RepID=A0A5A7U929_CUCMM|nr:retrotransposon protein [Cucumis melo var. makuwa]TYK01817.1 retrotransposon protein [Cucumis melo var. makuwa]